MKKNHQAGFSIVEALLILVIISILGFIGWTVYNTHYNPKHNATNNSSSTTTSQSQPISSSPSFTTTMLNGLTTHIVTLPIKQTPSSNPFGQNTVIASMGRYIAEDTSDIQYSQTVNEGGKLIYDGTTVYNGPYLFDYGLSQNGQHYIYVLDTNTSHSGGKFEIYVDGKLKQTYDDTQNDVTNLAVSNDGADYAYLLGNSGTNLVKNGESIYTNSNSMIADFSADLSKYIVATGVNTDFYDVVVSGQQVASHVAFGGTTMPSIAISENGLHYIYTDGKTLYEDGKSVATGGDFAGAIAITDTGNYGIDYPNSNKLIVNSNSYTLTGQDSVGCNPACGYSKGALQLAISTAGNHYILGTQSTQSPLWYIDGKQIDAPGNIESVEFVKDTLYLYIWQG